jgi:aminobenzoyl-glutamate transport protein
MNTMGYILVLTFFCYNFLGLLSYSGLGSYITYLGAEGLMALGLQRFPVLLLIGFILTTAIINIFIGGLTSKWMLLGPIFVPMLYFVNPAMTPDLVAAAFRVADSSTNIITPMMTYAGVILAFMRKYRPGMNFGDMLLIMLPYSIAFLLVWTALLVGFFTLGIPLGLLNKSGVRAQARTSGHSSPVSRLPSPRPYHHGLQAYPAMLNSSRWPSSTPEPSPIGLKS